MLSALLCAVLLASCVAVPISGPLGPPLYGNKIDVPTAASAVAVGQSRDSVITAIGKPTVELTDLRILVYPWSEKTSEWLFISLLNNPQLQSGTTFTQADWAMLIALDDNDFVAHAGITKRSPSDSINTVARRWAEAQGLSVPPVKTSFALSPIPDSPGQIASVCLSEDADVAYGYPGLEFLAATSRSGS